MYLRKQLPLLFLVRFGSCVIIFEVHLLCQVISQANLMDGTVFVCFSSLWELDINCAIENCRKHLCWLIFSLRVLMIGSCLFFTFVLLKSFALDSRSVILQSSWTTIGLSQSVRVFFFSTYFVSCNGPCAPKEKWHRKEHIIIIIIINGQ